MTCATIFPEAPGSTRWRTLPDGLWLNFGGTPVDPFVDIFAIEACGSLQNLLDKRSRFAPSTHSLLAVCPVQWLLSPVMPGDPTPRWKATGVLVHEPTAPLRPAGARHARALRSEAEALPGLRPPPVAARARILRADGGSDRLGRRQEPGPAGAARPRLSHRELPRPAVTAAPVPFLRQYRARQVRPIGDQPVHAPADQPAHVLGPVDRPRHDPQTESVRLGKASPRSVGVSGPQVGPPSAATARGTEPPKSSGCGPSHHFRALVRIAARVSHASRCPAAYGAAGAVHASRTTAR